MESFNLTATRAQTATLREELIVQQGIDVAWCYQCGKCSAGCPMAQEMDYAPHQILRLLQLGRKEDVLRSKAIWLCTGCATCTTRCPRKVELARLLECLRHEAKAKGLVAEEKNNLFFELFLVFVKGLGRSYEAGLVLLFNIFSWQPFKDLRQAPFMLYKGKINPFPHKIKETGQVQRIFARVKELGGEKS